MPEGSSLPPRGGDVKIDRRNHRSKKRECSWTRKKPAGKQDTSHKLCVVVERAPKAAWTRQELKVSLNDVRGESLELLTASVCGQDAALAAVVDHQQSRTNSQDNKWEGVNPGSARYCLEELRPKDAIESCAYGAFKKQRGRAASVSR